MRTIKKILAVLLAAAMSLALMTSALAVETYSITIQDTSAGRSYAAYQIFTGDLSGSTLSNIQWGTGVTESGQASLLSFNGGNYTSAAALAAALTDSTADAFAKEAAKCLTTASGSAAVDSNGTSCEITGLEPGYYLVKETTTNLTGTNVSYSAYILKVAGNVKVSPKTSTPTLVKTVQDINDSTDNSAWQDSADYDIGDSVPFQLTVQVGSNYGTYDKYALTIHDVQSAGLTFDASSVAVKVGDTTLNSTDYTVITSATDGCTFHIVFDDLKNIKTASITAGSTITVNYNSTLNKNALIGSTGNTNKAHLEYSNNPNVATSTGTTPDDQVVVFTYQLVVNKVDENQAALAGADFTLYKYSAKDGSYISVTTKEAVTESTTTFTWTGLDDGEYKLMETTTPSGYNTIDPIEFTVTAEHKVQWTSGVTSDAYADPTVSGLTLGTVTTNSGILPATIQNNKGSTLPSTGGSGTTLLYAVGGVLVVGAGVLLIAKKRTSAED